MINDWLRAAFQPSVIRRALKFAVVVGAILISINHLPAIIHGDITRFRILQMCLTAMVPYVVSTLSSVGAIRQLQKNPTNPNRD